MDENNQEVKTEETQVNETATEAGKEIVIEQSKGRKALQWVVRGLALVASGVTGFFLGRASKGSDDSDDDEGDSPEEGPKDE